MAIAGNGDKEGAAKLEDEAQDGFEKQPHKPASYNAWMQVKVGCVLTKPDACLPLEARPHAACLALRTCAWQKTHKAWLDIAAWLLSIRGACGLQLEELKEAAEHDPEQKHSGIFKQAADMWATLPMEEKDRKVSGVGRNPPSHDTKTGAPASSSADMHPEKPEDEEVEVAASFT